MGSRGVQGYVVVYLGTPIGFVVVKSLVEDDVVGKSYYPICVLVVSPYGSCNCWVGVRGFQQGVSFP